VSEPLLSVEDLHAGYVGGVDVLQGVSLAASRGSLTLIIGPNGAGKSTLLKVLFGFLRPHRGGIRFGDAALDGLEPHAVKALGIGYVPQEINVFPLLTVEENLRMGGFVFRRDKARLQAQLAAVYATFPVLADRRREPAGALSGGQARMLSVAREMMAAPALMLVDEPTAGLAPGLVDQVYDLLQTARRSIGATILLVDQNVEDAIRRADYVYMLDLGRIRAEGPARDFPFERASALFREALLG
jgi:ABC-type branched-subunit amino acid transport system ATPase component